MNDRIPRITFDLDALRSFVTGIELGGFAKAADRVGRSASAVSAQLKKLEDQIGAPILQKSGRGRILTPTGECFLGYARRLLASGLEFDMLFGPAYKGIPLVAATAMALSQQGTNLPYAYNRKEAKDHGEGGTLVGAPVQGRVLIIDDVISAGTSVKESIAMIQAAGATPVAVSIALDRQEKAVVDGQDAAHSAVQFVQANLGLQVSAIATLKDLLQYLESGADPSLAAATAHVAAYRDRYGV